MTRPGADSPGRGLRIGERSGSAGSAPSGMKWPVYQSISSSVRKKPLPNSSRERRTSRRVDRRVDQQRERGVVLDRDRRGEVAARAVAADRDAVVALRRPLEGARRVVDVGRERVLGRLAVLDAQHVDARVPAEHAARRVVRVEVADDEAAAVQVEQRRFSAPARPSVAARGQAGDAQVLDRADRDVPRPARERRLLAGQRAAALDGERSRPRPASPSRSRSASISCTSALEPLAVDDDRRAAARAGAARAARGARGARRAAPPAFIRGGSPSARAASCGRGARRSAAPCPSASASRATRSSRPRAPS